MLSGQSITTHLASTWQVLFRRVLNQRFYNLKNAFTFRANNFKPALWHAHSAMFRRSTVFRMIIGYLPEQRSASKKIAHFTSIKLIESFNAFDDALQDNIFRSI